MHRLVADGPLLQDHSMPDDDANKKAPRDPHLCAHCDGSGTCDNGGVNRSCLVCVNRTRWWLARLSRPPLPINATDLPRVLCSVCHGKGVRSPTKGQFAAWGGGALFLFLLLTKSNPGLDQVRTALVTILGTVVGYYYGGTKH
jgi:hypothetical protein